ncbi:MAG: YIP1 family protein [Candidatus Aenigmarchaeota archaeon]|nr:YIP1 family protein [Candidatus Aenigmarchaeota archaeon]
MIDFNLWKKVLTSPVDAFKKAGTLSDGLMHIVVAGLISGFISGLAVMLGFSKAGLSTGLGIAGFVGALIGTPIMFVIGTLIVSVILLVFAKLLSGKGDYGTQTYCLALYGAPLSIILTIAGLIPIIGALLSALVALYSLYLLTIALRQTHQYTIARAVLTWLIPTVVLGLLVFVMVGNLLLTMMRF